MVISSQRTPPSPGSLLSPSLLALTPGTQTANQKFQSSHVTPSQPIRDLAGRILTSVIIATFSFNLTRNRTLILSLFFQQEEIPNTRHWKYFYCNCTEYVKVLMIWCDHNSVLATHALNHNPSIPKAFRPSKYICNWVFSEARRQSLPPPADPAEPGGPDEQGRDSAAGRLPEDQGRL